MGHRKIIGLALLIGASVINMQAADRISSPKQSEAITAPTTNPPAPASSVNGHCQIMQSHIKSLGTIGTRYEVISVKVRGLDTPNVAGFLIYDSQSDAIVGAQTSGSPGLGVALVNGGAYVAGSYLFGAKLRPDTTAVNNASGSDSSSTASGGSASANANSSSTASGSGSASGGSSQRIPPGLINNPGHSKP